MNEEQLDALHASANVMRRKGYSKDAAILRAMWEENGGWETLKLSPFPKTTPKDKPHE